jgi:predicted nuclease with TOPRIM domain
LRARKEEWEGEREALREEIEDLKANKRKLEYAVYDLLKLGYANKDKLDRIRTICDES